MIRWMLIVAIVATIPFLIYSGLRHRLAYALSATVTLYLILIGVRFLTGFVFFTEELQNTIGVIVVLSFVAITVYMVLRYYADRVVQRKLRERRERPETHRSLLDNVRRSLRI